MSTLQNLSSIYEGNVKPLEMAYKYSNIYEESLLGINVYTKPILLLIGPWSTGKTTIINYLLNLKTSTYALHTGAEPTTSEFYVIQHGPQYRMFKGMQLVSDQRTTFGSLEKFGQDFLEHLKGVEVPSPLLEQITIVDTPGIMENKKQQRRSYPFSDVLQWFIQSASIIFLVFDPTKLEMGAELEHVYSLLKGHDSKVRMLLNKADTVSQQELMKVHGTLFWGLASFTHTPEPPRIYVGSFWLNTIHTHPLAQFFLDEEKLLLQDLNQVIENQIENKIAFVRSHAIKVRLHALTIDSFLQVYYEKRSRLFYDNVLYSNIIEEPEKNNVFLKLLEHSYVSKFDLPNKKKYANFFKTNPLLEFQLLQNRLCQLLPCPLNNIDEAIDKLLPQLLNRFKTRTNGFCINENC
ncbi:sarcalumenin-like [Physella acuta]|uniref:sarcalumenin-like n=1 Tax=Physella acuta TaxID=109671 RepID=UPI0027DC3A96|nr:sarcalumenin-like [Physella acuta]